ncbi:hypothetical protein [Alcanivorax sp. DP30]|uniref:hypothetical protein n=1 Tax=Alcanivorax sp. DP30 TaxID=2606217 RepID=UPI001F4082C1|nr:hypothetical protein [Alcanivorax sp. DP30]
MKREKSASLKARYLPISKVSVLDMRRMYEIYSGYYENISLDLFCRDMSEKDGVFLVAERSTKRVVGFSTMKTLDMKVDGRPVRGIFSGDTIIEKEYWGSKALHVAFFFRVIREKLRHPVRPLFWLLISKGYKTYLLMANNFHNYYPNIEGDCEKLAGLVDNYCDTLFRDYYCSERKLLDFGSGYTYLKSDVAGITDEMRKNNEKIQFFESRNPSWQRGTELPCIGEVSYSLMLGYPMALWLKLRRKSAQVAAPVIANN